jgi:hypothetical protein
MTMAFELTPWRPFRELAPFREFERMRREMDRLWDSFFEGRLGRFDTKHGEVNHVWGADSQGEN